jgi:hypothetical protein
VPSDAFRKMFGDALADQVDGITGSRGESKIGMSQALKEAQELKEICDGALNGVYGPEGEAIAEKHLDQGRAYYAQQAVKKALIEAGLLRSKP